MGAQGARPVTDRGQRTRVLWGLLWGCWLLFVVQQIWDVARFSAPWPVWVLRVLPLLVFMPGIARDNLRSVVWLCFVILFYFVSAVELMFARPGDWVAVTGLVAIVALFLACALYIRFRGPEQRLAAESGE